MIGQASGQAARKEDGASRPDQSRISSSFEPASKRRQIVFRSDPEEDSTPKHTPDSFLESFDDNLRLNTLLEGDLAHTESRAVGDDEGDGPLGDRLLGVWPRFQAKGADGKHLDVPFVVSWEICRIALHCDIDFRALRTTINIGEDWRDQDLLRQRLRESNLFKDKSFPSKNDAAAWKVALGSGRKEEKAVIYAIDCSYNQKPGKPLYDVRLRPLVLDLSHRMIRRFGADRWIELNIPSPAAHPPPQLAGRAQDQTRLQSQARLQLVKWLTGKEHRFLGRSWTAVFVSDESKKKTKLDPVTQVKISEQTNLKRVRLFATNGDTFRPLAPGQELPYHSSAFDQSDRQIVCRTKLLQWALGLNASENQKQLAVKLFARLQLVFSRTIPTVVLEEGQIEHVGEQVGSHADMADGAGTISPALAKIVAKKLGLSEVPCAFQARIGGCKGMWCIDINLNADHGIWLKTFPSQRKFMCDYGDPLHRTFDVRDWPKPLTSATLNPQFTIILDNNAIDKQAMRQQLEIHLEESLKVELTSILDDMHHTRDLRAWLKRVGISSSERSTHGYVKYLAGGPKSSDEEIAVMLDSGFNLNQKYLADQLEDLVKRRSEWLRDKLKVSIPDSTYAFMLPDFTGSLKEGEVSVCLSQPLKGGDDHWLEGDLLVGRSPAHYPSDLQKVQATVIPELRRLKDVVLFSIHGHVSLADKISGGDFDGDIAWLLWEPEMVKQFRNENVVVQSDLGLEHDTTTFQHILATESRKDVMSRRQLFPEKSSCRNRSPTLAQAVTRFVEHAFDFNTREVMLGKCTKFKDRLTYHRSLKDSKVMKMGKLLSLLVDAPKQGTLFYSAEWDKFRRDNSLPTHTDKPAYENKAMCLQQGTPPKSVLDWLTDKMNEKILQFQSEFSAALNTEHCLYPDPDISRLVKLRIPDNEPGRRFLTQLKREIEAVAESWPLTRNAKDYSQTVATLYDQWVAIRPSVEFAPEFTPTFITGPNKRHDDDFSLLKAAVTFDRWVVIKPRFVWRMAGRQICRLKALASGIEDSAPVLVTPFMYAALQPDQKLIKRQALLRQVGEAERAESESDCDGF